jgi:hypothetical protein
MAPFFMIDGGFYLTKEYVMSWIKKLSVCLAVAMATGVMAAPATRSATTVSHHQGQQVLFVVSAGGGEMIRQDGQYVLSVELKSIDQILQFTEQPLRLVKYIRSKSLRQAWYGKTLQHNFAQDAPNAVLAVQDMQPVVVTMTSMHMHGSKMVLAMRPIKPGMFRMPMGHVHEVALTIDMGNKMSTASSSASSGVEMSTESTTLPDQIPLGDVMSYVDLKAGSNMVRNSFMDKINASTTEVGGEKVVSRDDFLQAMEDSAVSDTDSIKLKPGISAGETDVTTSAESNVVGDIVADGLRSEVGAVSQTAETGTEVATGATTAGAEIGELVEGL